ncbi:hypothetical protein, partial [Caballeronia sp. ATUFL_F2_KS9A]|uniref:hypothetical protein n=1 Tax=Caballeronia sp. ATUFL_F2_KS9A TaxID=2921777 RepID=UPI002027C4C3
AATVVAATAVAATAAAVTVVAATAVAATAAAATAAVTAAVAVTVAAEATAAGNLAAWRKEEPMLLTRHRFFPLLAVSASRVSAIPDHRSHRDQRNHHDARKLGPSDPRRRIAPCPLTLSI